MTQTMRAAVITAPHRFEVREMPVPVAGPGQVLVRMMAAGVCGSDHHLYHGANPNATYPRIPGHENAGIVAVVGEGVERVAVGDHVIVDLITACGTCHPCSIGRRNVCRTVRVKGSGVDGGWREYIAVPENEVYRISPRVPWVDAALVEPFAIGAHCTARGRVGPGDTVFILGAGTIGAVILQHCKARGCGEVICCDVSESALERALRYGADHIIRAGKEDVVARVGELTRGLGVTVAFDAACYPGSLALCLQPGLLMNAGRVVPMGFVTVPEGITQAMINQREIDIIGSRMSCFQFEPTIEKMERGAFNLEGLVTTVIPFSRVEEVFHHMDNPDPAVRKMVIRFDE